MLNAHWQQPLPVIPVGTSQGPSTKSLHVPSGQPPPPPPAPELVEVVVTLEVDDVAPPAPVPDFVSTTTFPPHA
jgi:hypothetical protein